MKNKIIYRKALNQHFSYIGKNNYLSYVFQLARIHDSVEEKRQVSGNWNNMSNYLNERQL